MTDEEIADIRTTVSDYNAEALLADGFEEAFIGVAVSAADGRPPLAVYDIEKCILVLMKRDGMDFEEASEFLAFNTLNAWVGDNTPLFLHPYNREEP